MLDILCDENNWTMISWLAEKSMIRNLLEFSWFPHQSESSATCRVNSPRSLWCFQSHGQVLIYQRHFLPSLYYVYSFCSSQSTISMIVCTDISHLYMAELSSSCYLHTIAIFSIPVMEILEEKNRTRHIEIVKLIEIVVSCVFIRSIIKRASGRYLKNSQVPIPRIANAVALSIFIIYGNNDTLFADK